MANQMTAKEWTEAVYEDTFMGPVEELDERSALATSLFITVLGNKLEDMETAHMLMLYHSFIVPFNAYYTTGDLSISPDGMIDATDGTIEILSRYIDELLATKGE